MTTRALVDANVLYSRTLRDWLIMIQLESEGGIYELCWTEDILAEAITRFRDHNPTVHGRVIAKMHDTVTEYLGVGRIDDYRIDGSFPGADPHDQHVHAAAIAAGATYLITDDPGFRSPGIDLDSLPYEVHTPDSFLVLVDDSAPHDVRAVTRDQERYWDRKPGSKTLVQALQDAGCPDFAQRVLEHLCQLPADDTPT
ncbi:PIN domain-containing protein [Jiangella sp. DSM 45060]|uniref:PIN domain-containing protein n=1 Tax=Jiangella sp. DSM 45060 TaxID=1798224 RepID=UPI00087B987D|nr:PIN domain-containing protein [Jiangella sp. DSM 45060]SDT37078.1 PIN domain-containing protein [Jiangella sp. DSM 45060]